MKNKQIISPVGLKGKQILERQLSLMGIQPINENENKKNSAVELTKIGPDGNAYAIVRENHEYYIKRTNKTTGLVLEDFKYIGGLQNKKEEAYPSYARAIKQLNFKFKSLAEAFNKGGDINVFEDDNLLSENARLGGFSQMEGNGFSGLGNLDHNEEMYKEEMVDEFDEKAMQNFIDQYGEERGKQIYYATANKEDRDPETFEKNEGMASFGDDVELNEFERAIEEMMARQEESKFPDFTGDGEVTQADILKGRGVFEDDDYVDYTMGNEEDPNQLPNPPREINIPEELHGGQHKLDVDDDGEIEASDLAALRAMEESIAKLDNMINSLSEGTLKKKVLTKK